MWISQYGACVILWRVINKSFGNGIGFGYPVTVVRCLVSGKVINRGMVVMDLWRFVWTNILILLGYVVMGDIG